ncbi:AraC family transcriptional regulator [Kerstersia gyiorum]|uniref:AraC family transcriptional regulator n=1 Tax=Kerstersia gyiorum TaxID=206506 RepID=UPI001071323B|nr:AraC family transcriptional regulator [Kerstersia gyiorum]MCO7640316.1 AraC family transcriptional regulator [Pseudomonas sp. S 311-6]MCP1632968.1 AraC-like DNA-binding protein [Kerstersia gyiorum]MCP1636583.1 AraC-like DNA-binding protein [Kerstersia gyiorum]MCP1670165.1 AraC-like DNA-binding protein [Kerstersia gyiorum]MCP1679920.1 AraC-like DNA-binding protein [Kerstersia gyiorum]
MQTMLSHWEDHAYGDLDQAQAAVSNMLKPHRLCMQHTGQALDTRVRHADFGRITLSRLCYGADVRIQPEHLAGFYLVQIPLYGSAQVRCGNEEVDSNVRTATLLNPNEDIDMRWRGDSDQVMLKLERSLVEGLAAAMDGTETPRSVSFPVRFEAHASAPWKRMMRYLLDCAHTQGEGADSPLLLTQIEQLAASTLLSLHPHRQLDDSPALTQRILPRHIKRVETYLQEHAHEAVRGEDLAHFAGVSLRSLYAGFREYCGISPMQYLRGIRLERARRDLLDPHQADSVSTIALRWGFSHLGRFSAEYRQRFGETPSASLQRRHA